MYPHIFSAARQSAFEKKGDVQEKKNKCFKNLCWVHLFSQVTLCQEMLLFRYEKMEPISCKQVEVISHRADSNSTIFFIYGQSCGSYDACKADFIIVF